MSKNKSKSLIIIVGNSVNLTDLRKKNFDIYYVNSIFKEMNLNFLNKYKKILIVEPYFGNVLERRIKKKIKKVNNIHTISYQETIIHKYGSKFDQDKFLHFDEKSILKKINQFN